MYSDDFCSLENNSNSFYCKTVELVGPLPKEYHFCYGFVYLIAVIILVCMPLIILKMFTGGSK